MQRSSAFDSYSVLYRLLFTYVLKLLNDSTMSGCHHFSFTRLDVDVIPSMSTHIFSIALFQLSNGLVIHVPPVL